jgi:hypothetical protein
MLTIAAGYLRQAGASTFVSSVADSNRRYVSSRDGPLLSLLTK